MCRDKHDLADLSVAELRQERADLRRTESRLSYERRLVQGRIDVLRAELTSRAPGSERAGSLADRLAVALTDRDEREADAATVTTLRIDVPQGSEGHFDESLVDYPAASLKELEELAVTLEAQEAGLSAQRRDVFAALDRLVAELADRYREDVPVRELLGG